MNEYTVDDFDVFTRNELEYKIKVATYLEELLTEKGIKFSWQRGLSTPNQYAMYIRYLKRLCGRNNVTMEKARGF